MLKRPLPTSSARSRALSDSVLVQPKKRKQIELDYSFKRLNHESSSCFKKRYLLWIVAALYIGLEVSEQGLGIKENGDKKFLGFIGSDNIGVIITAMSLFALQGLNLHGSNIQKSAKKLSDIWYRNKYPKNWPIFPKNCSSLFLKYTGYVFSFLLNGFTLFVDGITSYFYMLKLGCGPVPGAIMLLTSVLAGILTETIELHQSILRFFKWFAPKETNSTTSSLTEIKVQLLNQPAAPQPPEEKNRVSTCIATVLAFAMKSLNSIGDLLFGYAALLYVFTVPIETQWFFLAMSTGIGLADFFYSGKFNTAGLIRFNHALQETIYDVFHCRIPPLLPILTFIFVGGLSVFLANILSELMLSQIAQVAFPFVLSEKASEIITPCIPALINIISYGTATSQGVNYLYSFYDPFYKTANSLKNGTLIAGSALKKCLSSLCRTSQTNELGYQKLSDDSVALEDIKQPSPLRTFSQFRAVDKHQKTTAASPERTLAMGV